MFLSIKEMQRGAVRFKEVFQPGAIEFLDEQIQQAGPLQTQGTAELVASIMEIRVRGHLAVRIESECDRCLEAVDFPIDTGFDLLYRPTPAPSEEEVEIDDAGSDIGFYRGDGLELADVLREQILLTLPMQRICRQDCKGICPVCGQNRNQVDCRCHQELPDDRWSGLRNLQKESG